MDKIFEMQVFFPKQLQHEYENEVSIYGRFIWTVLSSMVKKTHDKLWNFFHPKLRNKGLKIATQTKNVKELFKVCFEFERDDDLSKNPKFLREIQLFEIQINW